jgi:hypothetical protein
MEDLEMFEIKNWRGDVKDRDKWRELITKKVKTSYVHSTMKQIVKDYKDKADRRRADEKKSDQGKAPRKVIEVLVKDYNNKYTCPNCNKQFQPQGITGHVRACAQQWCKQNNVIMLKK